MTSSIQFKIYVAAHGGYKLQVVVAIEEHLCRAL
jgi:hypothetical protein